MESYPSSAHTSREPSPTRSRHSSRPYQPQSSIKVLSTLLPPVVAVIVYATVFRHNHPFWLPSPSPPSSSSSSSCPAPSSSPPSPPSHPLEQSCRQTCRLTIVESIPENVSFGEVELPMSTYDAWQTLIDKARHEINIAAYKSSLRGKHNLGTEIPATQWGSNIFNSLVTAGKMGLNIRMVENFHSKDPGDNADGHGLVRRGAVERRSLDLTRLLGKGMMHSKFLVVDNRHFYIGSANLDWRSLNQKMELGVLMRECPCLGSDMNGIFNGYWSLSDERFLNETPVVADHAPLALYNKHHPLQITHQGVPTSVYIATSPRSLNGEGRGWDLDAILSTIDGARDFLYIHVMDYIPMIVYSQPQRFWPVIDDSVRRAVMERGVEVRLLAAALHFVPQTLRFLKSLATIDGAAQNGGSISIKIFKVPVVTDWQRQPIIARDRRTHNKFVVNENTILVGTSNWAGDYFHGSTGLAFVATQNETESRPLVDELKDIFIRDWESPYAHELKTILDNCLHGNPEHSDLCEEAKNF